jgi:hypothetical protein
VKSADISLLDLAYSVFILLSDFEFGFLYNLQYDANGEEVTPSVYNYANYLKSGCTVHTLYRVFEYSSL